MDLRAAINENKPLWPIMMLLEPCEQAYYRAHPRPK